MKKVEFYVVVEVIPRHLNEQAVIADESIMFTVSIQNTFVYGDALGIMRRSLKSMGLSNFYIDACEGDNKVK